MIIIIIIIIIMNIIIINLLRILRKLHGDGTYDQMRITHNSILTKKILLKNCIID